MSHQNFPQGTRSIYNPEILNENQDFGCVGGRKVSLAYIHLDDGLCEAREWCGVKKCFLSFLLSKFSTNSFQAQ